MPSDPGKVLTQANGVANSLFRISLPFDPQTLPRQQVLADLKGRAFSQNLPPWAMEKPLFSVCAMLNSRADFRRNAARETRYLKSGIARLADPAGWTFGCRVMNPSRLQSKWDRSMPRASLQASIRGHHPPLLAQRITLRRRTRLVRVLRGFHAAMEDEITVLLGRQAFTESIQQALRCVT